MVRFSSSILANNYITPTCSPNFKASRSVSMLKTYSTKNFFNQVSRKAPLRTSPKLSRCRHGRRRVPVSLLVLLCKTSAKYFGTEDKILSQSLKAGHGSSPYGLELQEHTCAEHPGRMFLRVIRVQIPCAVPISKPHVLSPC